MRVRTTCLHECFNHHRVNAAGMRMRGARTVLKTPRAFGLVAPDPFIRALPTDPKLSAQLCHGLLAFQVLTDQQSRWPDWTMAEYFAAFESGT